MAESKDKYQETNASNLDKVSGKAERERDKATSTVVEQTRAELDKLKAEVTKGK